MSGSFRENQVHSSPICFHRGWENQPNSRDVYTQLDICIGIMIVEP